MSDALSYLVAARPEAMGHYFAFLKDAGKHLDPKTKALISVITKVHAQTERGFKQYLKRALREGCTPMEILDALLMAFPALGLARIVWAVDIILEMKLPGFDPEALARQGAWHDVMAPADLGEGEVRRVECDGRGLFVYRAPPPQDGVPPLEGDPGNSSNADDIHVYDSLCPHQGTNIPQLALEGTTLTCPKHEWAFDVRSGACIRNGDTPLRRFESRVVDGRLQAFW